MPFGARAFSISGSGVRSGCLDSEASRSGTAPRPASGPASRPFAFSSPTASSARDALAGGRFELFLERRLVVGHQLGTFAQLIST